MRIGRICVFVVLLSLSCCTSASVPPSRPVVVEVPVALPCVAPAVDHPVWPLDEVLAQSGSYEAMQLVLAEIELREAYETKLRAALETCR